MHAKKPAICFVIPYTVQPRVCDSLKPPPPVKIFLGKFVEKDKLFAVFGIFGKKFVKKSVKPFVKTKFIFLENIKELKHKI